MDTSKHFQRAIHSALDRLSVWD